LHGHNKMLSNAFFTEDEHEIDWFVGRPLYISSVHLWFISRRQLTASFGEAHMLESIAVILIILWVLGLVSSYTLGGFIHILLVIAIIVIVLRVIQGRPV
jgi:hypothetical protein